MVAQDRRGRVLRGEGGHRHPRPRMRPAAAKVEPRHCRPRRRSLEGRHQAVWAPPVEGTLARRKQRVEARWCCQCLWSRSLVEVQSEVPKPFEDLCLTLGFLLDRIAQDGRGIHDDLEPLYGICSDLPVVLRAEIERRIGRHFTFGKRCEFRFGIVAEKHRVVGQFDPRGDGRESMHIG